MKDKILQRLIDLFRVLPFLCIIFVVIEVQKMVDHRLEYAALRKNLEQDMQDQNMSEQEKDTKNKATEEDDTVVQQVEEDTVGTADVKVLDKLESLYQENKDLVGWIRIKDTIIDYPIVQGTDDSYYLSHNFQKEDDKYGCLFIKINADSGFNDQNTIIYAHNMRDNEMFGSLDEYRRQEYEKIHSTIYLDTLYEEREYEIIAVCESKVMEKGDDSFKYYQFTYADSEQEFQKFVSFLDECELYRIGDKEDQGISYDITRKDSFLMLSTCAYDEENARLVVVAKRTQ